MPLKTSILSLLVAVSGLMIYTPKCTGAWVTVTCTPYEQQMRPVSKYVHLTRRQSNSASIQTVNSLMTKIRKYNYHYDQQWHTPEQTRTTRRGDCKDKSLLLLSEMTRAGGGSLMLVIGQRKPGDRLKHVWLEWKHNDGVYILDATFEQKAKKVSHYPQNYYRGEYAFIGNRKFSRAPDNLMAGL